MASAQGFKYFSEIFESARTYDHDPGGTGAVICSPDGGTTKNLVSVANLKAFGVIAGTSVSASSSGITLLEIVGCTDSSGTNVTQIVTSGAVTATAVNKGVLLECSMEQVAAVGAAAGYDFTHVGARLTCSNSGDEAVVTYLPLSVVNKTANSANTW